EGIRADRPCRCDLQAHMPRSEQKISCAARLHASERRFLVLAADHRQRHGQHYIQHQIADRDDVPGHDQRPSTSASKPSASPRMLYEAVTSSASNPSRIDCSNASMPLYAPAIAQAIAATVSASPDRLAP